MAATDRVQLESLQKELAAVRAELNDVRNDGGSLGGLLYVGVLRGRIRPDEAAELAARGERDGASGVRHVLEQLRANRWAT